MFNISLHKGPAHYLTFEWNSRPHFLVVEGKYSFIVKVVGRIYFLSLMPCNSSIGNSGSWLFNIHIHVPTHALIKHDERGQ